VSFFASKPDYDNPTSNTAVTPAATIPLHASVMRSRMMSTDAEQRRHGVHRIHQRRRTGRRQAQHQKSADGPNGRETAEPHHRAARFTRRRVAHQRINQQAESQHAIARHEKHEAKGVHGVAAVRQKLRAQDFVGDNQGCGGGNNQQQEHGIDGDGAPSAGLCGAVFFSGGTMERAQHHAHAGEEHTGQAHAGDLFTERQSRVKQRRQERHRGGAPNWREGAATERTVHGTVRHILRQSRRQPKSPDAQWRGLYHLAARQHGKNRQARQPDERGDVRGMQAVLARQAECCALNVPNANITKMLRYWHLIFA
jgi:hypothetical protein